MCPPHIDIIVVKEAWDQVDATLPRVLSEDSLEGPTEVGIEDCVDDWVEGGVGIAQPGQDLGGGRYGHNQALK